MNGRGLPVLVAVAVAVAAAGLWWIHPAVHPYRWLVTALVAVVVVWPLFGFGRGLRNGFYGLRIAMELVRLGGGRGGKAWGAAIVVPLVAAWTPRLVWAVVAVVAVAVAAGVVFPRFSIPHLDLVGRFMAKRFSGAAVRREWQDTVVQCMTGHPLASFDKAKVPPTPKLLRGSVKNTDQYRAVSIKPPASWDRPKVWKLASKLAGHWGGHAPTVQRFDRGFGRAHGYRITIHMKPLPAYVKHPATPPAGPGVPFATGLSGVVERLVLGGRNLPAHILVCGKTRFGKSRCVRAFIAGFQRLGEFEIYLVDPKGQGDLDGIIDTEALVEQGDIADLLERLEAMRKDRAERIKYGETDGMRSIVVVIDELIDVIGPLPKGATNAAKRIRERAIQAFSELTQKGGGADIHLISCTQEPSAEMMGGSGFLRRNHHGRILIGQADRAMVEMMFEEKNLTEDDLDGLSDAKPGRALVCGLTPDDSGDVRPCQIWDIGAPPALRRPPGQQTLALDPDTGELIGGGLPDVPEPQRAGQPEVSDMERRVLAAVTEMGPRVAQSAVARHLGVAPSNGSLRRAVQVLADRDVITAEKTGPRGSWELTARVTATAGTSNAAAV